jgi:hypothetical protein
MRVTTSQSSAVFERVNGQTSPADLQNYLPFDEQSYNRADRYADVEYRAPEAKGPEGK